MKTPFVFKKEKQHIGAPCFLGFFSPLLFEEIEAVKEVVHPIHHRQPCSCASVLLQTIFPLTQAVISLPAILQKVLVCEVQAVHILMSTPTPTSSRFSFKKNPHSWETENNWHIISAPMHSKHCTTFLLPQHGMPPPALLSPWHLASQSTLSYFAFPFSSPL